MEKPRPASFPVPVPGLSIAAARRYAFVDSGMETWVEIALALVVVALFVAKTVFSSGIRSKALKKKAD